METKKVEAQFDISKNVNPNWRKLWDILLRPVPDMLHSENKAESLPQAKASETSKQVKESKPQQLSLFELDKSEPERDDPGIR